MAQAQLKHRGWSLTHIWPIYGFDMGLRWETADECEKRIVGARGRKTAEKTQKSKVQVGEEG